MVRIGRPPRNYAPGIKLNELQEEIKEATRELGNLLTKIEEVKSRIEVKKQEKGEYDKKLALMDGRINEKKEELAKMIHKTNLTRVQNERVLEPLIKKVAEEQKKLSQLEYIDGQIEKAQIKLRENNIEIDELASEISLAERKKIDLEKNTLALEVELDMNHDSFANEWAKIEGEREKIKEEKVKLQQATEAINIKQDRLKEQREEIKSKYR